MGLPNVHLLLNASPVVNREIIRFYDKGFDWIVSVGPRLLAAGLVLFLGLWLIKALKKKLKTSLAKKNVHSSLKPFLESLVYASLYIALIFLVLQILGIRLTVFAAVIAAFGAATGLALSGTLQNFASGVLILLLKPFDTGANIVAQGVEGTVTAIRIFYTVITTFDNRTVIMPNSKLSNEVIVNITHQGVRRLDIELKFKNTEPVETVKAFLAQVFAEIREVLHEPAIRIGVSAIEEDSYKITCNIWINAHGFEDTRMMINEKIVSALSQRLADREKNISLRKED